MAKLATNTDQDETKKAPQTCMVDGCARETEMVYEIRGQLISRCQICHDREVAQRKITEMAKLRQEGVDVDPRIFDHYRAIASRTDRTKTSVRPTHRAVHSLAQGFNP